MLNLFDDAIERAACPACGREVAKPLRWFKLLRELLGPLAVCSDGGGEAAANGGAAAEEGKRRK